MEVYTMKKDMLGLKIGNLEVIEEVKERKNGYVMYKCRCVCGNEIYVSGSNLRRRLKNKTNVGCGCGMHKNHLYKHGLSNGRIYRIYALMKQRCNDKNCKAYKNYGGRGIKICEFWENDFMSFYNWSINNGYDDSLTLDRIDNNKGYSPENCRWVDRYIQSNNRRNNTLITYKGETKTIPEFAREYGLEISTLRFRIYRGWSIERALTEKTHPNYKGVNNA